MVITGVHSPGMLREDHPYNAAEAGHLAVQSQRNLASAFRCACKVANIDYSPRHVSLSVRRNTA